MKYEEFDIVEKELKIVLPEAYKQLVISNPFKRVLKIIKKDRFFTNHLKMIYYNKIIRKKGYFGKMWNKNYFIIGYYREDTYRIIDLKDTNKERIYAVIREDQDINSKRIKRVIIAETYKEFVRNNKELYWRWWGWWGW
ncbi:MAG: SMI1/KNR4 family protein [Promethearchaeota archaeon]